MQAQDGKVLLEGNIGHNAFFGEFGAISVEVEHSLEKYFAIKGGVQYNTIGRTAIEARPAFFHDMKWGQFSAEVLLHYVRQSSINNYVAGAGLGISGKWAYCKLGYYYRTFSFDNWQINEIFNIYYEGGINFLPMCENWDLQLVFTNSEMFELERHYQPSYKLQGWYYPIKKLGLTLGLSYKPSGMFNMSAGYYQLYTNLGICYKW